MISILTPTYNRAYTLTRLYDSLKSQTSKEFEWIVIDDGSTDNTFSLIKNWSEEEKEFHINYIKQENGGKHRALNKGVLYAKYEYIYILDSDDYLTTDAIETIKIWLKSISNLDDFAGVSGLKGRIHNSKLEILGDFPKNLNYVDATNLERRKKRLLGDKAEVIKTSLLKKFPFPEFEGEKFLSEIAVWNRFAEEGYKYRWFNQVICICEYLEDGLTKNNSISTVVNNFQGYTYVEKMNVRLSPFLYSKLSIGRYIYIARKKKMSNQEIREALDINKCDFYLGIIFNSIKNGLKRILN